MNRILLVCVLLAGCGNAQHDAGTNSPVQQSWWQWHAAKRSVDMTVSDAVDPPNKDYAKGIAILRASDRPDAVKEHEIGFLIIGGFETIGAKRSSETLEQGLQMIESAATRSGETREYTPQHLRLLFERGAGVAPNNIPIDPVVANCWHKLENGGAGDPAHCVELRRQRLPHIGR